MASPMSNNKRRSGPANFSAEEQALDIISKEAETRELKTNAFLSEARKLRSTERERLRKEEEDKDGQTEEVVPVKINSNDRPNSQNTATNDVNEKLSKLLISNAQLDNERQMLKYEVNHLKDVLSEAEEQGAEYRRKYKQIEREREKLKDEVKTINLKCDRLKNEIRQRNEIIKNNDLTIVCAESLDDDVDSPEKTTTAVLSFECLNALSEYSGTLGEKLLKLFQEKKTLSEENERLRSQTSIFGTPSINDHTPLVLNESTILDVEAQRQLSELKLNLRKAEQEITTLQGTVTRLDTQLNRYKAVAENSERAEEELKMEKRKLQIEARYAQTRMEELESQNGFLLKRIEKIKTSKSLLDSS